MCMCMYVRLDSKQLQVRVSGGVVPQQVKAQLRHELLVAATRARVRVHGVGKEAGQSCERGAGGVKFPVTPGMNVAMRPEPLPTFLFLFLIFFFFFNAICVARASRRRIDSEERTRQTEGEGGKKITVSKGL